MYGELLVPSIRKRKNECAVISGALALRAACLLNILCRFFKRRCPVEEMIRLINGPVADLFKG